MVCVSHACLLHAALLAVASAIQPVKIMERLQHLGLVEQLGLQDKRDLAYVSMPDNYSSLVEGLGLREYMRQNNLSTGVLNDKGFIHRANVGSKVSLWGHVSPTLQAVSPVTGCHLADTPPKYWPANFAKMYFENRTRFGLLQDPYTRLVNYFKSHLHLFEHQHETCDINTAVVNELGKYSAGDKFGKSCAFIPQSEYLTGKYGATELIDARDLSDSLETLMSKHDYEFNKDNFATVLAKRQQGFGGKCQHLSARSFTETSRQLIKHVYHNDFALLCQQFLYCDTDELL